MGWIRGRQFRKRAVKVGGNRVCRDPGYGHHLHSAKTKLKEEKKNQVNSVRSDSVKAAYLSSPYLAPPNTSGLRLTKLYNERKLLWIAILPTFEHIFVTIIFQFCLPIISSL